MSVTVTVHRDVINIEKGVRWDIDGSVLYVYAEDGSEIAAFRDWHYVTKSAVKWDEPDQECAADWRKVLLALHSEPDEVTPAAVVRALQQAQLYVMQQANKTT